MEFIFRVQVAGQEDNGAQPDILSQGAAVSVPNPVQDRPAADVCVRPPGGKRDKVTQDTAGIP